MMLVAILVGILAEKPIKSLLKVWISIAYDLSQQRCLKLNMSHTIPANTEEQTIAEIVGMVNWLYQKYLKSQQQSDWCERVLSIYYTWQKLKLELADVKAVKIARVEELQWRALIDLEVTEIASKIVDLRQQLDLLLIDIKPYQARDVLLEIQALDGDDAGLFVENLVRMYTRYAEDNKWKVELVSEVANHLDGFDLAVLEIRGAFIGCFLQFEAGRHQVIRRLNAELNSSESAIATAMVTVMPIIHPDELEIDPLDLELKTSAMYHPRITNTTGVSLYHKPTKVLVLSDRQRSQFHNKQKAFQILLSKLYTLNIQKHSGTDDRSRVVRTYDYSNNCVTEIGSGMNYPLDRVLAGDLDPLSKISCAQSSYNPIEMTG